MEPGGGEAQRLPDKRGQSDWLALLRRVYDTGRVGWGQVMLFEQGEKFSVGNGRFSAEPDAIIVYQAKKTLSGFLNCRGAGLRNLKRISSLVATASAGKETCIIFVVFIPVVRPS